MEPNFYPGKISHHFPTNQLLDAGKIIPDSAAKKSDVVCFFEDLYTYPPQIKIQWKQLNSARKSNKITHNPSSKSFLGIREYADKVTSYNFYNNKIHRLKHSLANVPVYVIVNGRNELVLATAKSGKFHYHDDLIDLKRTTEKALSTKSKKFGFMFFDLTEAELYLATMIERSERAGHNKRDNGVDKVGLSIHCIGLDTAYTLLTRPSNIDYRFVPRLTEVTTFLKSGSSGYINNKLFAEGQQLEQTLSQKVLSPVSDQSDSSFKGVPIYCLQIRNKPRNFVSRGRGDIVSVIDGFHDAFISGFDTIIRPNKYKTESIHKFKQFKKFNSNGSNNYVFFDREQAIMFSQKLKHRTAPTIYPTIYTHNLEDFLESWEESLLLGNNTFPTQGGEPVYFLPSKRSVKNLNQHYNRPKDSLGKSIKVWGRRKLDKLFWFQTNYLGLILRGYRI